MIKISRLADYGGNLPAFSAIEKLVFHYLNGTLTIEVYFPLSTYQESMQEKYQHAVKALKIIREVKLYYH